MNNAKNNIKSERINGTNKKNFRMNIFIEYRKVLNTVPTLGGVKSAFHEAKQESIINYETDNNSPYTTSNEYLKIFSCTLKTLKREQYWSQTVAFKGE